MPTSLPEKKQGAYRRAPAGAALEHGLLGASLFIALVFCLLTSAVPRPFVLPALSVVVMLAGIALGGYALAANRFGFHAKAGLLDIAGVLALFGFAAAIVCDKSEALQALIQISGP